MTQLTKPEMDQSNQYNCKIMRNARTDARIVQMPQHQASRLQHLQYLRTSPESILGLGHLSKVKLSRQQFLKSVVTR